MVGITNLLLVICNKNYFQDVYTPSSQELK
jgi:hypothetical protein